MKEQNRLLGYAEQLLAAFPDQPTVEPAQTQLPLPATRYPVPGTQPPIPNIHYPAEPLSARELEVLRLLAAGMSNPEIAAQLVVEVSTVRSHCKSIYGKLDVHKRWDAVRRAQELGLIRNP